MCGPRQEASKNQACMVGLCEECGRLILEIADALKLAVADIFEEG